MNMAYMRGDPYIYSSGNNIEFHAGGGHVSLAKEYVDAFVLMRMSQLLENEPAFKAAVDVATGYAGNFGGDAFLRLIGKPTAIDFVKARIQQRAARNERHDDTDDGRS